MDNHALPKIIVRLPEDLKEWLVAQAADNSRSMNGEVLHLVKMAMKASKPDAGHVG